MVSEENEPHTDPERQPALEIQDTGNLAATPDQHAPETRASDQGPEDFTEMQLRVEKLRSDIEKITLEKKQLERQLSRQSLVLDWVKVAAVVGALGAPDGLEALEGLALVFKPEEWCNERFLAAFG